MKPRAMKDVAAATIQITICKPSRSFAWSGTAFPFSAGEAGIRGGEAGFFELIALSCLRRDRVWQESG